MPKYIVWVREVWVQPIELEAAGREEATQRVADGEGMLVENGLEYPETLDHKIWLVQQINDRLHPLLVGLLGAHPTRPA